MFIKMKESKGFTLVELMIVVAIIGILAAVAVPFYQRYIQKSRLTSMVYPGLHIIETNVGNYYSFKNEFPDGTSTELVMSLMSDADTDCFTINWLGGTGVGGGTIELTLENPGASGLKCKALKQLAGASTGRLLIYPLSTQGKITSWAIGSTTLSNTLGLAGEGSGT